MAVRIVRLGSPRGEARARALGTVRRPPRGVPKAEFASRDFYDVWLPNLAPSEALAQGRPAGATTSARGSRRSSGASALEMKRPEASRVLDAAGRAVARRGVLRRLLLRRTRPLPPLDPSGRCSRSAALESAE